MVVSGKLKPLYPWGKSPDPIRQEAVWAPEVLFCTMLRREKYLTLPRYKPRYLDRAACSLICIPTELRRHIS
jgi:hypothetical protein